MSDESKRKIALAFKDKPKSDEHKRKISNSLKGVVHSEETRQKISKTFIEKQINNFKNGKYINLIKRSGYKRSSKPHTEETKQKMSKSKIGINNPNYGKHLSEDTKRKISLALNRGCNSYEPYSPDFTIELKVQIKIKYHGICQLCFQTKTLVIHHIDYDKKNTTDTNLIPLCKSCHSKTNYNREKWRTLFLDREQRPTLLLRPKLHLHIDL